MHGNTTKYGKVCMAIGIVALLTLSVIASGCLNTPKEEVKTDKIRVGFLTADLHHLAYFVAKNQTVGNGTSFFDKYGVKVVDALTGGYANGGAEMDDFASADRKLDLGYMGAPPSITKYLNTKGLPKTRVISQVNEIGSALVVAKDINNVSDLKGKKVAVPSHSAIQFFLFVNYLKNNGIEIGTSSEQVVAEDTPVGQMKTKLQTGEIAGFIAWEPFPTDAIQSGIGKILIKSNEIWNNHLDCVIVVNKDFAEKNKELIDGFLKAHISATNWINNAMKDENSTEYKLLIQIAVSFTARNETVVKEALKNINFKNSIDNNFFESFITYTNKLVDYNIVGNDKLSELGYSNTGEFANDYIDESYMNTALKG